MSAWDNGTQNQFLFSACDNPSYARRGWEQGLMGKGPGFDNNLGGATCP